MFIRNKWTLLLGNMKNLFITDYRYDVCALPLIILRIINYYPFIQTQLFVDNVRQTVSISTPVTPDRYRSCLQIKPRFVPSMFTFKSVCNHKFVYLEWTTRLSYLSRNLTSPHTKKRIRHLVSSPTRV